jgi:hypothetical protein
MAKAKISVLHDLIGLGEKAFDQVDEMQKSKETAQEVGA